MNRLIILMLSFTLAYCEVRAQSETYQIEKLTKPEKLLPTVSSDKLFNNIHKDFVKLSVSNNLVDLGTHPVIVGYLRAYQNHYPITISPDIMWLLISKGFSNHVNNSPEELRSQIVSFKGKKTLTVVREMIELGDMKGFDWESIFPEFAEQISGFTGKALVNTLTADFTTTTPTARVASQITIMESMKEFFNYKVTFTGCGIPEVTVEGSVKDWEKILTRLDYLAKYDLEWWTSELKPVIQKIIDTKKGKVDKQFWMNMVKYHKLGVYGAYDGIDGWLLKFYPYLTGGTDPALVRKARASDGVVNLPIGRVDDISYKTRTLYLRRSTFKEIKNVNELPKELSNVPFVVEVKDDFGKLIKSFNMELWAGFMGIVQDPKSFNIKPEIGWAVNKKSEIPVE
ncbi:MAG TPA: DUF4419 domain-containing protein [Pedobacter sp.]